MTNRRIACVVVPEGYKDEAEFATDCSLEIVKPAGLMRENGELCEDIERHIQITTDQQHTIERLRSALKAAAIVIETKAPTTIEGILCDPWDDLLQHIEAILEGKDTQPSRAVLRRAST